MRYFTYNKLNQLSLFVIPQRIRDKVLVFLYYWKRLARLVMSVPANFIYVDQCLIITRTHIFINSYEKEYFTYINIKLVLISCAFFIYILIEQQFSYEPGFILRIFPTTKIKFYYIVWLPILPNYIYYFKLKPRHHYF